MLPAGAIVRAPGVSESSFAFEDDQLRVADWPRCRDKGWIFRLIVGWGTGGALTLT
jgi:hypothetical protein